MLLFLAILPLLAVPQAAPTPAQPPQPGLPAELVAYYSDYNFVNAFSTQLERRTLASRLHRSQDESDGRLRAVRQRMQRLAERTLPMDPGIVADRGNSLPVGQRADLLEVRAYRLDEKGGTAAVELDVIQLLPPGNAQLIRQFDQLGRDEERLTGAQLATRTSTPSVLSREIHNWTRLRGTWVRETPTQVLIVR